MLCMICNNSDDNLFNVGRNFEKINRIADEQFVGRVRALFTPDSWVCIDCINILDNGSKLESYMWDTIPNPCNELQSGTHETFRKLDEENMDNLGDRIQSFNKMSLTPTNITSSYRSSPSTLLTYQSCEAYNSEFEAKLGEKERLKSLIKSNTLSKSEISEAQKFLKKMRKGRKSKKKSRSGSALSSYSVSSKRSRATSTSSIQSNLSERVSRCWTRSLSRAQEEENRLQYSLFHCTVTECNMSCDDINTLNEHNRKEHKMLFRYFCAECHENFTTFELFKLHGSIHDNSSFYCLMCGIEQKNSRQLQKHLDDHMINSVPCSYCDKSFLTRSIRDLHSRKHQGHHQKRRTYNKQLILDRIDK